MDILSGILVGYCNDMTLNQVQYNSYSIRESIYGTDVNQGFVVCLAVKKNLFKFFFINIWLVSKYPIVLC